MMTLRVRLFLTRCIYAYIGACTPMSIGWDNCPSCEGKDNQGEVQWVSLPERLAACLAPVTDRGWLDRPTGDERPGRPGSRGSALTTRQRGIAEGDGLVCV